MANNLLLKIEVDTNDLERAKAEIAELNGLLEQTVSLIGKIAASAYTTLTPNQAKKHLEEALVRILGEQNAE